MAFACAHVGLLLITLVLSGCASSRAAPNPSFSTSLDDAQGVLDTVRHDPRPLDRPLVLVGGFADFGIGPFLLDGELRELVRDRRIIRVQCGTDTSFQECRRRVIEAVDSAYPNSDPARTTEVDAIGLSMGGLVARYAAVPKDGHRALRIARLFTLGSPLQGSE